MNATFKQASHLLKLVADQLDGLGEHAEQRIKELFDSGLLSDLLTGKDPDEVDRGEFRHILGLAALVGKQFTVDVKYCQNVHNMVQAIKWVRRCDYSDIPVAGRTRIDDGKALCVPVNGVDELISKVRSWNRKGLATADFRETLAVFKATEKRGAFICAPPVPKACASPGMSGIDFEHYCFLRNGSDNFLVTSPCDNAFFATSGDAVFFRTSDTAKRELVRIRKHQIYVVMIIPANKDWKDQD